jgi:hypothetical protein
VRRFFTDMNPTLRGFLIIALIAGLFLLWRERRSDIETWSTRSRYVFYGAAALAVVDVGALIGLGASGPDALAFFLVLAGCVYAAFRIWREEHRYS